MFKVGDTVKVIKRIRRSNLSNKNIGDIFTVKMVEVSGFKEILYWIHPDDNGNPLSINELELVNLTPTGEQNKPAEDKMSLLDTIKLARKSETDKSLIKAGLMDMNGYYTAEGQEAFMDLLHQKFDKELKTEYADKIIEEQNKNLTK